MKMVNGYIIDADFVLSDLIRRSMRTEVMKSNKSRHVSTVYILNDYIGFVLHSLFQRLFEWNGMELVFPVEREKFVDFFISLRIGCTFKFLNNIQFIQISNTFHIKLKKSIFG